LHEEERALRASRDLLDEVLSKTQDVLRTSAEGQGRSINVTFERENYGMQISENNGPISGITFGAR
ncbi:hypothetical protein PHISCL_11154, partial [Aspergillus sclerotialis]